MKKLTGILIAVIFVFIDQLTKIWAKTNLEDNQPIEIIKGVFELRYLENTGAAFGLFRDRIWYFVILTVIVIGIILFVYWKIPEKRRFLPLNLTAVLILSGAVGNLVDRIRLNYVIDFLYFKLIDFPIFNIADCYVTIGAVLLLYLILFRYKEEELDFLSRNNKIV